jgi:transposase
MALGKRKDEQQQMWVASSQLPRSAGHVFYRKLNGLLAAANFDGRVEELCKSCYHDQLGRPSIPPGVYFRMILVGYFEGINSQRGIAWRCSDSLSLREFLGIALTEDVPDHSSLTRLRDRLSQEIHDAVFHLVLQLAAENGLLKGKTVAVDSTNLEANAAMKSIVRRDSGEDWNDYLRRLLKEEQGVENPTDEELRRFDRQRQDKRVPNAEWMSPSDADSRIAKMKDGRTHLAYKAEHVVDLETEVVLAASIRAADEADVDTLVDSVTEAMTNLSEAGIDAEIKEVVADKGYYAADTLELAAALNVRTYIPEPKRKRKGKRNWRDASPEKRQAVEGNRRRTRGARNKQLQRRRSERVERSFAHICETGGARRSWLRGLEKIQKRYLIAAMARNLGLLMRKLFAMGTPRGQQAAGGLVCAVLFAWLYIQRLLRDLYDFQRKTELPQPLSATSA